MKAQNARVAEQLSDSAECQLLPVTGAVECNMGRYTLQQRQNLFEFRGEHIRTR